jgi:hypothetical protein
MKSAVLVVNAVVFGTQVAAEKWVVCSKGRVTSLLKNAPRYEGARWSGGIAPSIRNLGP